VGDWEESGSPTVYDLAHKKVREILSTHYPEYIQPGVDAKIRENFPIQIELSDTKPGNGRWD
jgi:trimethylamine--corrinoid protein Co-methyltransferase